MKDSKNFICPRILTLYFIGDNSFQSSWKFSIKSFATNRNLHQTQLSCLKWLHAHLLGRSCTFYDLQVRWIFVMLILLRISCIYHYFAFLQLAPFLSGDETKRTSVGGIYVLNAWTKHLADPQMASWLNYTCRASCESNNLSSWSWYWKKS
jgi:hypothetical protein